MQFQKFWLVPSAAVMALAGCAGTSSAPTGPGVRAVNGLSSVSQAVVMFGATVVSPSVGYATSTSLPHNPYAIVPQGSQILTLANVSTPTTIVDSTTLNINSVGLHYDEIAYNPTTPTFISLIDNFSVPTNCNVRFVNASTVSGNVDIILTPPVGSGSAMKFTLNPGQVAPVQPTGTYAYQTFVTAGAYGLQVFPAGQDSGTPLLSETITLPASTSFTYVLLDPYTAGQGPVMLDIQDNQLYDSAP